LTTTNSQHERVEGRERKQRDWLIFLLLLLLGFVCLLCTAQVATRQLAQWQVPADMFSELNPEKELGTGVTPVEPLRPEVMTLPWDPDTILTPVGTPSPVPTGALVPFPTATATAPQAIAEVPSPPPSTPTRPSPPTPTRIATPVPTPTDTPVPTPTATPTATEAPTLTPTPTATATATDTPIPPRPTNTPVPPATATDTPVPATATDTPMPTDTPTATATDTPTPTPLPPSVLSITPDWGYNDTPVDVVITGDNFFGLPTARLGSNVPIGNITLVTADTLNGTVPADIPAGTYALTVINPDGQFDTLSPAYTALTRPNPDTTLETGYLTTHGSAAPGDEGDDDHVQVIFFEVPDGTPGDLYVRIFDADTGGGGITETVDAPRTIPYDTTIAYTLFGGGGAYTDPGARSSHPGPAGINVGTLLAQTTIGADPAYHGVWQTVFGPFSANQGELVGSSRMFKLAVEGVGGDEGNRYNVALSTVNDDNAAPGGSRIFAYSWTFQVTAAERPSLYSYVPTGTVNFEQYNWDADHDTGTMTLHTPMRDILVPDSGISGNNSVASSPHQVQDGEAEATWTIMMDFAFTEPGNDLTFWTVGDGIDLAIFTHPTTAPPP